MSQTETFSGEGSYSWTVPDGVDEIEVLVDGAGGGGGADAAAPGGAGGNGARIVCELTVSPNDTIDMDVGGGGEGVFGATGGSGGANGPGGSGGNGIDDGGGGGGGGYTEVLHNSSRELVAGAGGGGGGGSDEDSSFDGGDGGPGLVTSGSSLTGGGDGADSSNDDGAGGGGGAGYDGGSGGSADVGSGGTGGQSLTSGTVISTTEGGGASGGSAQSNGSDGQVEITYEQQPDDLQATVVDGDQIDLTWEDTFVDEDGFNIYRAQTSGGDTTADYSQIDSVSANTTSYSDTGLEDGEEYYYRVTATDSDGFGESNTSNEESGQTPLPTPTLDNINDTIERELTINYTLNDDSSDGDLLIERSTDGGSSWSDLATITDLTLSSYTDSGLLDGEQYSYRLTRRTDHASQQTAASSTTTQLLRPTNISVSEVSGDNITVAWDDNANNGNYRLYVSRDGGENWTLDTDGISGTSTQADTSDLLDGEEYRLAVGVYTEHVEVVTGADNP